MPFDYKEEYNEFYLPPKTPGIVTVPAINFLAVQGQIITGRSTDQICFCEGLETLYTLVEAGFAFAVIADLPQLPMPEIQIIPVREVPPLSYGLSYRAGEMGPVLRRFLARMEARFSPRP